MGKYSVLTDPAADAVVERELGIIVPEIVQHFGEHLSAVLLAGGFGRGEGSIVIEEGHYRPLNDYDLILVVPRGGASHHLQQGMQEMNRELDAKVRVKQVDMELKPKWKLALPAPSVGRFELKHGHLLLWGEAPAIRAFPARWLPIYEGTTYYRNRAGGLLIAKLLLDGQGSFHPAQRNELVWLELNKAALAMGDAQLILRRRYHHSYSVRRDRMDELGGVNEDLRANFQTAIDAKLQPSPTLWEREPLDHDWHRITTLYLQSFLEYESRRLGIPFPDLGAYETWGQSRGGRGVVGFRLSTEDSPKHIRQRLIMMRLLQGATRESRADIKAAASFLNISVDRLPLHESWQRLTRAILKQWHPAGIAVQL